MKKPKINSNTLFKYFYALIILGNITVFFYLYNFLDEYVYKSFAIDQSFLEAQVKMTSEGINKAQFEEIDSKIEKKLNQSALPEKENAILSDDIGDQTIK